MNNQLPKSFYSFIYILFILILTISCGGSQVINNELYDQTTPRIKLTYPKPDQTIGAVDSTFVFGQVHDNWKTSLIKINGQSVPVHKDGGFLAFIPIEPGEFTINISLYDSSHGSERWLDSISLIVNVPKPIASIPTDSLAITREYHPQIGNLSLTTGDKLEFSFIGTPGLRAYATIEGLGDMIPMIESQPQLQPFWGENVFGGGAVPDSMKIEGIYTGQITIPADFVITSMPVVYHLRAPDPALLAYTILTKPNLTNYIALAKQLARPASISLESSWLLSTNSDDFPFVVQFTDSMQIIRHQPGRGYFSVFQPEGLKALAVGMVGEWFKLKLSETQYAYCEKKKVKTFPVGSLEPSSLVRSIRTFSYDDSVVVTVPLSDQHLYQITEQSRHQLSLRLFGVTTDTDWIRYDATDQLIDFIRWSQPEPDLYEITINLHDPIWGYETHYDGNTLMLSLNRAPEKTKKLKGKRIVIDPGHSSDKGAVGPTGLTEAEANLGIALVLEKMLSRAGAEIIMTRNDMSHVDLYGRPEIAKAVDADLFISIHNNALPDGVNPFENNGVSAYYYHLHSLDLARAIQKRIVKATGAHDHGLYHGNLAVNRPTQYPAVLVECAFMMIPEQEAALKTTKYQKKVAKAIMNGIKDFLKAYDDEAKDE